MNVCGVRLYRPSQMETKAREGLGSRGGQQGAPSMVLEHRRGQAAGPGGPGWGHGEMLRRTCAQRPLPHQAHQPCRPLLVLEAPACLAQSQGLMALGSMPL